MSLPNVNIVIGAGNMGSVTLSDDGIAGLILTGTAVANKLELNKVYILSSTLDLPKRGIDESNNPFLYKELMAFYNAAGEGAELHLLVVSEATTLTQICANTADSPLKKLVNSAAGRIRLVGINRNTPAGYSPTKEKGLDKDVITAIAAAHVVAEGFLAAIAPFRILLPAIGWDGTTDGIYQPREGSYNRVGVVLASDGKFGASALYSAAIGQILGRAAKISVHQNIGRVRNGAIATDGYMMDGKTTKEHFSEWNLLDDAGYIFYRTYVGKNGFYLNGDSMAAPTTDSYCYLSSGRVIDKAVVITYKTYIDEILDNIDMDPDTGSILAPMCKSYEASIERAIGINMSGEVSSFSAYINPKQNVLANGKMDVVLQIMPKGTLRIITVNLSLYNPANK